MLPAHVNATNITLANNSKIQQYRDTLTAKVRINYTRLLVKTIRYPLRTLSVLIFLLVFSFIALMSGMVKVNFFASDPIRLYYVNVEMPTNTLVESTIEYTQQIENVIKQYIPENELRAIASYAGMMFTETEAVFGDNYGQIMVSLKPHKDNMHTVDQLIDMQRDAVLSVPGPSNSSFLRFTGLP